MYVSIYVCVCVCVYIYIYIYIFIYLFNYIPLRRMYIPYRRSPGSRHPRRKAQHWLFLRCTPIYIGALLQQASQHLSHETRSYFLFVWEGRRSRCKAFLNALPSSFLQYFSSMLPCFLSSLILFIPSLCIHSRLADFLLTFLAVVLPPFPAYVLPGSLPSLLHSLRLCFRPSCCVPSFFPPFRGSCSAGNQNTSGVFLELFSSSDASEAKPVKTRGFLSTAETMDHSRSRASNKSRNSLSQAPVCCRTELHSAGATILRCRPCRLSSSRFGAGTPPPHHPRSWATRSLAQSEALAGKLSGD